MSDEYITSVRANIKWCEAIWQSRPTVIQAEEFELKPWMATLEDELKAGTTFVNLLQHPKDG